MSNETEWRCQKCHTFLAKVSHAVVSGVLNLEVNCPHKECKQVNVLSIKTVEQITTSLVTRT